MTIFGFGTLGMEELKTLVLKGGTFDILILFNYFDIILCHNSQIYTFDSDRL
jgi:hypothetical protein